MKHAKVQFLGRPFCSFGSLTCWGHRYSDSGNITKAERRVDDNGWEREQYITVDASFLASYSRNYGFIPLLVVDSRRFSEYSIAEVGVNDGWEEISGESFRYSLYTGSNKRPANRPRMTSRSIIYGKRLLFMDECRK